MPRHAQEGLPPLPTGGLFVGAETDKVGESPVSAVVALPPGADDDVLTVVEGAPAWAAPSPPSGDSGLAPADLKFWPGDLGALPAGIAAPSWAPLVGLYKKDGRIWLFGFLTGLGSAFQAVGGGGVILPIPPAYVIADGGPAAPLFGTGDYASGPESANTFTVSASDATANATALFPLYGYSGDDASGANAGLVLGRPFSEVAGYNATHTYNIGLTGASYVAGA